MEKKTCCQLWKDYAFLTGEMKKSISLVDWALFEDLARQRILLQEELAQRKTDEFRDTMEGKALLQSIYAEQQDIVAGLETMKRRMGQQHEKALAYIYNGKPFESKRLDREI